METKQSVTTRISRLQRELTNAVDAHPEIGDMALLMVAIQRFPTLRCDLEMVRVVAPIPDGPSL